MNITAAESHVMDALWRRGLLNTDEITAEVAGPQGWGEATVKTLIYRLMKKQAIGSVRRDGRQGYEALIARADYIQTESQGLTQQEADVLRVSYGSYAVSST
jgi:predicted transcriptional regulator